MFMIFLFSLQRLMFSFYCNFGENKYESENETKQNKPGGVRDNLSFFHEEKLRSIFHDPRISAGNLL